MSCERRSLRLLRKDNTSVPINLTQLTDHLTNKLGLRSKGSEGTTVPVYLLPGVEWARFEILEGNDTVVMEVDRDDGTITRCYLSRGSVNPNEIHLQVTSGLKPEESHPSEAIRDAEVHGIFPLKIRVIQTGFSSMDGDFIGFYGSDQESGLEITQKGRVRFSWR